MEEIITALKSRQLGVIFLLKMVPLDFWDWKPDSSFEMRTISELANHIACSPVVLLECLQNPNVDIEILSKIEINNMPLNAEGLVRLYNESLEKLISFLENHIENGKEKKLKIVYRKDPTSIYTEIFEEIGHEWFHCGQLYVYLKQNNIPVNMETYYGIKDPDPSIQTNF